MNEDNSIVWKAQKPRWTTWQGDEYLGLCPRCRNSAWPVARAEWEPPKAGDPDDVKPPLVIHLAHGYELRQAGPLTAWVWSRPNQMIMRGKIAKRYARTAELLERHRQERGLPPVPPATPQRPYTMFTVPVEPGALVICRNPSYHRATTDGRPLPCHYAVRVVSPSPEDRTLSWPAFISKLREAAREMLDRSRPHRLK